MILIKNNFQGRNINLNGFTLVEITAVMLVIMLLYTFVVLAVKPGEIKKKTNDVVRISEMNKLFSAVESFVSDNGFPPDISNATRYSDLAVGSGPTSKSNGQGWIGEDISVYIEKLPIDPINDELYLFKYRRSGGQYEINTRFEYYLDMMAEDGGDNSDWYEKGTNLNIL